MKKSRKSGTTPEVSGSAEDPQAVQAAFAEVVDLIRGARQRALRAANSELIDLYWRIGEYISRKLETAAPAEAVMDELAERLAERYPNNEGFTHRNLLRMRQFYETYRDNEPVSALVRQLPWTHNLMILSRCHRPEEREFYLRLAIQEGWPSRDLDRQLAGNLFARTVGEPERHPQRGDKPRGKRRAP